MESLLETFGDLTELNDILIIEGSHEELLVKSVKEKILSNGDLFSGCLNAVTGDRLRGRQISMPTQEFYEGPFFNGKRHGLGFLVKLNGEGKFLGRFRDGSYERGTLITSEYTYVGLFTDNTFHGRGTLVRIDGSVYEGNFRRGVFSGFGKLVNRHGEQYIGRFRAGKKHGYGKMIYIDGSTYEGDWSNNKRDGVGILTYTNGRKYEGEYCDDSRHGKGTLTTNVAIVTGPWRNDKPLDGPGWVIKYPKPQVVYVGDAISCRPHGKGEIIFNCDHLDNLIKYEGQVLCGLRHGEGKMISCNGDESSVWKGDLNISKGNWGEESSLRRQEFHNSMLDCSETPSVQSLSSTFSESSKASSQKEFSMQEPIEEDSEIVSFPNGDIFRGHVDTFGNRQGFGIFSEASTGLCLSGQWKSSRLHGKGTIDQPLSGNHYIGTIIEGVIHGNGSFRFADGSKYTGKIMDGMLHGHGTFHDLTNEAIYVGDFFHSLKHGKGEEEYADGKIYIGPYVEGKKSGEDGCLYRKDGNKKILLYEGQWLDDAMTGRGTKYELTFPLPGMYQGQLKDGKRYGDGTFHADDGHIFEGDWLNDNPCDGDWVITYPDGSVYYGNAICRNGIPVPDGFGAETDKDGSFYSGGFQMGKRHGSGLCVFKNGEQWDGRWECGLFAKYGRARP
jgi:hypothetical protein